VITATRTLFSWSLRADAKSVYPHIVRAGFSGLILVIMLLGFWDAARMSAPGLEFFHWICHLNILLIAVAGISYFVTAVTEEKDSGTLALLRLAGVSPLAIMLSKSTGRLISALMLLLIQLPFTFLAITLGGVTWQQILGSYFALAAWLCLVANAALFCSVRCSSSGRAASLATALTLGFAASGPILANTAGLRNVAWITPEVVNACKYLHGLQQDMSIWVRIETVLSTTGNVTLTAPQFWRCIMVGGGLFLLSNILFNRYSAPANPSGHGRTAGIRRLTVGRCWRLPITWKDFLFFMGGRSFLLVKCCGYLVLVSGFVWFHRANAPESRLWLSDDLLENSFYIAAGIMTIEMLLYASHSLFQEARQSTIATLRMLPISTSAMLLQKVAAVMVGLIPSFITLIVLFCWRPQVFLANDDFAEMVAAWGFFVFLSTHLTVLLSLYTRWAALPLAILISLPTFLCVGSACVALMNLTKTAAATHNISNAQWIGVGVNFVWMWVFVLLPMELEIINRWNRLSRR